MMKPLVQSTRFKRDFKRMIKRGVDVRKMNAVLEMLVCDVELPKKYRVHKLVGNYEGLWECHIEPDWLLIYDIGESDIGLARTGTHADLFRK